MAEIIQTELQDVEIADALFAVGAASGAYNGTSVGIFTNDITPNKGSVIGDFTEPVYAGYARITPTWPDAVRGNDGFVHKRSSLITFQQGGAITTCNVYGCFLVVAGVAVAAVRFDDLIAMTDALSVVSFILDFLCGADSNGQVEIIG